MNISIGSMHSSVLGVATSNSAAASMAQRIPLLQVHLVPGQLRVQSLKEQLQQTVVNLQFLNNSGSDAYSFTLVDGITGLTAQVTALNC